MGAHGKSIPLAKKIQIISKWENCTKNKSRIARELHTHKNTVHKWISTWEKTGSLERKPGQGRKRELNENACARALHLLVNDHQGATAASRRLFTENLTTRVVSGTTLIKHVRQYAKEQGTPISCAPMKAKKRLTAKNKQQRYDFCCKHVHDTFKYVMFTDRCKFHFRHPGEPVQSGPWHFVGEGPQLFTVNHPNVFNVYAGITSFGTTGVWVVSGTTDHHPVTKYTTKEGKPARNITSSEYKDVLLHVLLPYGHRLFHGHNWVLQQDNDPTHAAASAMAVKAWNATLVSQGIKGGKVTIMANWPPNSPDLSIIENVWAMVQKRVDKAGCANFTDFKAKVVEELAKINPVKLFASIPERMHECIQAKGDRTKH